MVANNDVAKNIAATAVNTAVNSATNVAGYQVSRLVDLGVNGILNIIFGESKEDRIKNMNDHHDHLIEIVQKNKLLPPQERLSPREAVERDIHDTNTHINTALIELQRAQELSKCGVCKETLNETIDFVSEKTGEITDASEKVLAMQRLKETGEISPTSTWQDLNRKEKKLVETVVNTFRQARPVEEQLGGADIGKKKFKKPGRKPKKTRGRK